ncbi:MAG: phosphoglycerate dehydrogenase [Armatimonadota bacterium]|nr:phosphoglycerate dehydrogenase [Armatimonadota bacterium]MCX7777588.1 phosphoglycerate dehydrogenase [Armatimonadota bacterium]MDW8025597.1 phosphoglycerate dehydrogenase [Armatimonadota bacterium]
MRGSACVAVTSRLCWVAGSDALQRLRDAGVEVFRPQAKGRLSGEVLVNALCDSDAVIASTEAYTREVLFHLPRLRIIARWGVGYDAIDLDAATELGIIVTYTPKFVSEAVADLAFGLMLSLARKIVDAALSIRDGKWEPRLGVGVWGKTLGIVGCGRIGMAMAKRAFGFGMRVLAYDIMPSPEAQSLGVEFVSLERLLRESDFVSLNVPLTDLTAKMIGEREIKMMKPTAFLINTSRGGVVDEEALIKALREGWIAGAALDVYSVEPLPQDHPLRKMPNCICTPHMGTHDADAARLISELAVECVMNALKGRVPDYVVNSAVLKRENLRIFSMPPLL